MTKREKGMALLALVERFIDDNDVHCSETVYQCDRIVEKAPEFIEALCKVAGYKPVTEDDR